MDKIDKLDKKILSILSKNARIPFKDVAMNVAYHVPPFTSACNISLKLASSPAVVSTSTH